MYVKVYNVGNQWFREDNGALVGKEVTVKLEHRNVFITSVKDGHTILAIYGFMDEKNSFYPLCSNLCYKNSERKNCSQNRIIDFCNIYHHKDEGHYINVTD